MIWWTTSVMGFEKAFTRRRVPCSIEMLTLIFNWTQRGLETGFLAPALPGTRSASARFIMRERMREREDLVRLPNQSTGSQCRVSRNLAGGWQATTEAYRVCMMYTKPNHNVQPHFRVQTVQHTTRYISYTAVWICREHFHTAFSQLSLNKAFFMRVHNAQQAINLPSSPRNS